MDIETLAYEIGLEKEAMIQAIQYPFTEEMKQTAYALRFEASRFLAYCKAQNQFRMFSLRMFLELAVQCFEEYQKRNISKKIFIDTFRDITLWNDHCKKHYQEWGIDEVCWLRFHVCLEVFRLGRLAFQEIRLHEDISSYHLYRGEHVIEVHVAQGEPLNLSACMDSFALAMDFYQKEHAIFWGESWLLHPALKTMVSPHSNLYQFQDIFTVYAIDETSHQGEERVFGFVDENVDAYPEDTSLQRKLKAYLKQHGSFGMGKGIYDRYR